MIPTGGAGKSMTPPAGKSLVPQRISEQPKKKAVIRKYFGTDGIRGVANVAPMTPELALRLGKAITYLAAQRSSHAPRILIGKDTRLSGYMLETALSAGICAMGGRVILCGPVPTPAVAHLTVSMRADAGIVISASHNPYADNGIKVFGPDGFKLPDELEATLEAFLDDDSLLGGVATGPAVGRAEKFEDSRGRYVTFVKNSFPRELSLEGLHIVVDAAHGAAYRVAPLVFQELGAKLHLLGVKPTGTNINKDVGALYPEHMRGDVIKRGADLGIALDGDADRVIIVDEKGRVVDGDTIMALCASEMIDRGTLRKNTLVTTVMSNLGLERALADKGGKMIRTQVGDRYVVEEMRRGGYNFGGEQSGHLIFLDHASTGDGIVAALQVLAIMQRSGRPLSELAERAMERLPQVLENVSLPRKMPLENMAQLSAGIENAERELGKEGRVLVRWSGTEPKLRIMLEGPNESRIRTIAHDLADMARRDAGS